VLSTLVESLGLQRLVVSEWGLREGAVIGALSLQLEQDHNPTTVDAPLDRRSIAEGAAT